jgi:hypothetical protein
VINLIKTEGLGLTTTRTLLPSRALPDSGPLFKRIIVIHINIVSNDKIVQPLGTNDLTAELLCSCTGKRLVKGETDGLNRNVPFSRWVFQECALSDQTRGRLEGRSGRTTLQDLTITRAGKKPLYDESCSPSHKTE